MPVNKDCGLSFWVNRFHLASMRCHSDCSRLWHVCVAHSAEHSHRFCTKNCAAIAARPTPDCQNVGTGHCDWKVKQTLLDPALLTHFAGTNVSAAVFWHPLTTNSLEEANNSAPQPPPAAGENCWCGTRIKILYAHRGLGLSSKQSNIAGLMLPHQHSTKSINVE